MTSFQRISVFILFPAFIIFSGCAPASNDDPFAETVAATMPDDILPDTPSVPLTYLMGQFDPATHPDFTQIDSKYASRTGMYLRKDAYADFQKMYAAAAEEGIILKIVSATRNFYAQKGIWEAKWTGARKIENGKDASISYPDPEERALKILEYSSMPGTSRHHWGTDIDLNKLTNSWFESGEGARLYQWLTEHGAEYGFCQPYTPKGNNRPHGYNEEKWHWSYMPVSRPLTRQAGEQLKDENISGFLGAEVATGIQVVERYVLGVNADCK